MRRHRGTRARAIRVVLRPVQREQRTAGCGSEGDGADDDTEPAASTVADEVYGLGIDRVLHQLFNHLKTGNRTVYVILLRVLVDFPPIPFDLVVGQRGHPLLGHSWADLALVARGVRTVQP